MQKKLDNHSLCSFAMNEAVGWPSMPRRYRPWASTQQKRATKDNPITNLDEFQPDLAA